MGSITQYTLPGRWYLWSWRQHSTSSMFDHSLDWAVPGFGFGARPGAWNFTLRVSHWLSLSIFAGLVAFWAWGLRKRRYPPGHCRACDYDLRGNAAAVACPECGGEVVIHADGDGAARLAGDE